MRRVYEPVAIMRQFAFVRETMGANRGGFVDAFNAIVKSPVGSSWCASFLSTVLFICYQGPSPLRLSGSCDALYREAKEKGFLTELPIPGDLFFRVRPANGQPDGDAHHVGVVTQVYPDRVKCIAGNTSEDGTSSNGIGVFEHDLPLDHNTLRFVRLPVSA